MKLFTFCLSLIIACQGLAQQTDRQLIEQTLNNYIEGTSYSYPDRIRAAFYEDANLFLSKEDQELYIVKINDYASFFDKNTPGTFTGRVGNIISIDQYQNIATAKLEIIVPKGELRFIDLFLLKKLNNQWKIISKTATSEPSDDHGKRILFILSSSDHHGNSTISAGNSFSEIVNAHQQFKKAGYIVDFVSPEGGTAPLVYINTSVKSHLTYLYDQDFMESLKNTMQPTDVDPADYRAVYYVGGSGAMYGVPENEAIQRMVMEIYEKHDGIISSVCHGTAGIVNLKTSDGQYLVKNKAVSGYPDAFEKHEAEYYQHFPFNIQKTIEKRGGTFKHSPQGSSHLEVDGRLVTGQNHLSAGIVADKIIEMIDSHLANDQVKQ